MANLRANNVCGTGGRNAIDGSVFFDGTADQLNLATSTDWALGTGAYTVEFWVKAGRNTGENGIFGTFTSSAYGIGIWHNGANLYFEERQDSFSGSNPRVTYTSFVWNEWNHLAMSRDSTSGTMRAFVNGLEVGTVTSNLRDITATTETTIGFNDAAANNFIGNITNFRLSNTQLYTGSFDPPTEKLAGGTSTILLCCQDRFDLTQEATGKTITEGGDPAGSTDAPPVGVDEGVVFDGPIKINTQGVMYFPTGDTTQRGRGRGLNGGSSTPSNITNIDYFQIQSTGNSIDFGDLTVAGQHTACSSTTRGVFAMGSLNNTIDYVTIATTANAIDFGDRTIAKNGPGALSNNVRGVFAGGGAPNPQSDVIDYITIASTGNATDFGNMSSANKNPAGLASPTRGCLAHGGDPFTNVIDYITIATTGNASDFGDTTENGEGYLACASNIRGIFVGGNTNPANINTIQYITIATTGNAADFGDLGSNRVTAQSGAGTSNNLRGVTMGGFNNPNQFSTTMEYVNIDTTGNSFDFGYLSSSRAYTGSCSDSHGGLS